MYRNNFLYLPRPFRCYSHKSLHGKAGASALINAFYPNTGNDTPCRGKNRTIHRGNMFSVLLADTFIELPGSKLQILAKAMTLLTSLSRPKQGKTKMQPIAYLAWI